MPMRPPSHGVQLHGASLLVIGTDTKVELDVEPLQSGTAVDQLLALKRQLQRFKVVPSDIAASMTDACPAALALISKISEARAEAELPAVVSLKCLVHLAKNIGVELGVQIDELLVAHFKKLPAPVAEALPLQIRDARQSRLREGWFFRFLTTSALHVFEKENVASSYNLWCAENDVSPCHPPSVHGDHYFMERIAVLEFLATNFEHCMSYLDSVVPALVGKSQKLSTEEHELVCFHTILNDPICSKLLQLGSLFASLTVWPFFVCASTAKNSQEGADLVKDLVSVLADYSMLPQTLLRRLESPLSQWTACIPELMYMDKHFQRISKRAQRAVQRMDQMEVIRRELHDAVALSRGTSTSWALSGKFLGVLS